MNKRDCNFDRKSRESSVSKTKAKSHLENAFDIMTKSRRFNKILSRCQVSIDSRKETADTSSSNKAFAVLFISNLSKCFL